MADTSTEEYSMERDEGLVIDHHDKANRAAATKVSKRAEPAKASANAKNRKRSLSKSSTDHSRQNSVEKFKIIKIKDEGEAGPQDDSELNSPVMTLERPKMPTPSYIFFTKEYRETHSITCSDPNGAKNILVEAGREWREMSDARKQLYKDQALRDKHRFQAEWDVFEKLTGQTRKQAYAVKRKRSCGKKSPVKKLCAEPDKGSAPLPKTPTPKKAVPSPVVTPSSTSSKTANVTPSSSKSNSNKKPRSRGKKGTKGPTPAYMLYILDYRRQNLVEGDHIKMNLLVQEGAKKWKTMSDAEKMPFFERAKQDVLRYQKELAEELSKNPTSSQGHIKPGHKSPVKKLKIGSPSGKQQSSAALPKKTPPVKRKSSVGHSTVCSEEVKRHSPGGPAGSTPINHSPGGSTTVSAISPDVRKYGNHNDIISLRYEGCDCKRGQGLFKQSSALPRQGDGKNRVPGKHYHCHRCDFVTEYFSSMVRHEAMTHKVIRPGLKVYKCKVCEAVQIHVSEYCRHLNKHITQGEPGSFEYNYAMEEILKCSELGLQVKDVSHRKLGSLGSVTRDSPKKKMKASKKLQSVIKKHKEKAKAKQKNIKKSALKASSKLSETAKRIAMSKLQFGEKAESNELGKIYQQFELSHEGLKLVQVERKKQAPEASKFKPNSKGYYICQQCEFRTKLKASMLRHRVAVHNLNPISTTYYCKFCEIATTNRYDFQRHCLSLKHVENAKSQGGNVNEVIKPEVLKMDSPRSKSPIQSGGNAQGRKISQVKKRNSPKSTSPRTPNDTCKVKSYPEKESPEASIKNGRERASRKCNVPIKTMTRKSPRPKVQKTDVTQSTGTAATATNKGTTKKMKGKSRTRSSSSPQLAVDPHSGNNTASLPYQETNAKAANDLEFDCGSPPLEAPTVYVDIDDAAYAYRPESPESPQKEVLYQVVADREQVGANNEYVEGSEVNEVEMKEGEAGDFHDLGADDADDFGFGQLAVLESKSVSLEFHNNLCPTLMPVEGTQDSYGSGHAEMPSLSPVIVVGDEEEDVDILNNTGSSSADLDRKPVFVKQEVDAPDPSVVTLEYEEFASDSDDCYIEDIVQSQDLQKL